jgi:hypothetical protein
VVKSSRNPASLQWYASVLIPVAVCMGPTTLQTAVSVESGLYAQLVYRLHQHADVVAEHLAKRLVYLPNVTLGPKVVFLLLT